MPDAPTTVAVLGALLALALTVSRFRRHRDGGVSRSESLQRALWHDLMLNRKRR